MFGRRNPGWVAGLAAVVLVAACSDSGDSASTVPPTQPSTTQPGDADQSARILELEQAVGALTEELVTARDDLADARADIESLVGQVAGLTAGWRTCSSPWTPSGTTCTPGSSPYLDQYRLEMELLRPLIPLPDTPEARRGLETLEAFLAAVP